MATLLASFQWALWFAYTLWGHSWAFWALSGLLLLLGISAYGASQHVCEQAALVMASIDVPMATYEWAHFRTYALFYRFPHTAVSLSRVAMNTSVLFALIAIVNIYREVASGEGSWLELILAVIMFLFANHLKVLWNPLPYMQRHAVQSTIPKDPFAERAEHDLFRSGAVRQFLSEHPEVVGGDCFWLYAEGQDCELEE